MFYTIKNSNSAQKQGIRERVYEVSNPQTTLQATQRSKLLPAQRIAGALTEIIERGWQGVDYGAKSRNEFLKRALKLNSGFPYLEKGEDRAVPGAYQITKGTLPPVTVTADDDALFTNLFLGMSGDSITTMGELSSALIDNNANVNEGDQITLVMCQVALPLTNPLESVFYWTYRSFYVNPDSADPIESDSNINIATDLRLNPQSSFQLAFTPDSSEFYPVAGTCIISRLGSSGSHQRSSATLYVSTSALEPWFSITQRNKSIESYQTENASATNTNWPVDVIDPTRETYNVGYVITSVSSSQYSSAIGSRAYVKRYVDDDSLVAVYVTESQSTQCYASPSGQPLTYTTSSTPPEVLPLPINAVPALADLPKIAYEA